MKRLSCADLQDLAPELALGTLAGEERANAIAHLAGCAECRVLVEALAEAADSLLLLGPEAEPPLGFETRVAARLGRRARRRWPRIMAGAAAAAIAIVLAVVGVALRADHGNQLETAALRTSHGRTVGHIFAYDGKVPWVFMTIDASNERDGYSCVLDLASGGQETLGWFTIDHGRASWGHAVDVDLQRVTGVRLVSATGRTWARATLS